MLIPGLVEIDALVQWELAEVEGLVIAHIDVLLIVLISLEILGLIHHLSLVLGPHVILPIVRSLSQRVLVVLEVLNDDGVPPHILGNLTTMTLIFSLVYFFADQVASLFSQGLDLHDAVAGDVGDARLENIARKLEKLDGDGGAD